ncbi:MAG: 50S ribosomal protein L10 [Candidatus Diapherotrites archaeon]|nr:50S ribosomal protein L10 [Candidatus Diapherotrites archaeon]
MRRHTRKWKEKQLQELVSLLKEYPVVAIANIDRFPADLLQQLKKSLADKAVIRVSKARVIAKALEEVKMPKEFIDYAKGSIAIVFSRENPFELYTLIKKNEGKASAKPGMIAPQDIVVPKGDTGLPPGPALSDLKKAGLDVRIEGSSIVVPEDTVVAKEGEAIRPEVADVLAKLDIKPITLRLDIKAAIEDGQIFTAEILDIDAKEVENKFITAYRNAINLAVNAAYPTKESIELLIINATRNARNLAFEAKVLEPEVVAFLIQQASSHGKAIASLVKEPTKCEESKQEDKGEEKEKENSEGESAESKESSTSEREETQENKKDAEGA